jgi:PAS domain S-box-containing protein
LTLPTPESQLATAAIRWINELPTQGIFITDVQLVVQAWNAWMTRVTGVAAADAIGRPLFEVRPELVTRGLDRYYRAAIHGEASVLAHRFHHHLIKVDTAAGTMPQSSRVAPLLDGDRVIGTMTVIDDVSERVTTEAELRRQIAVSEKARASAEEAGRAKDEFLATLSHELRTPLNAVLGWTSILLGGKPDPALIERALHVIERNARSQARLIDDMLDMARIVSGKLRLELGVIDAATATAAAIDVVGPSAAAKRITIRTEFEPGPKLIHADAARLQQVVWNILANAVKFTPISGMIMVRLREADGFVTLEIEDNGKGIAPEFLPYVFDRFRQASSSVNRTDGGLGLGLSLVRQLVDMHGGQVSVTSHGLGHGATFTITFPAIATEALPPSRDLPKLAGDALSGYRVLVVDDDGDWSEALATGLQAFGARVFAVATAREALAVLTTEVAAPNVAVIDIGLPHRDGMDLLQEIRTLEGDVAIIPAVAVTAYAAAEDERRALNAGFDVFCAKPITPENVALAILEATRRTQHASQA